MAKYDSQLGGLKSQITSAKKILIALPVSVSLDNLASGLALLLSLQQSGKEVCIVSADPLRVSQSNLFGVGQVQSKLPQVSGGDLTLTLEGVVAPDGSVPSLEKLDWFPEGENLNLVFHILPGQKFEPKGITPTKNSGGFDIMFVVGALNLEELGTVFPSGSQLSSVCVNLDNKAANTNFGTLNIIDPNASTLSEMTVQIILGLGTSFDSEIASNIIAGIYDGTKNLSFNTNPDTFLSIGYALQAGGKMPVVQEGVSTAFSGGSTDTQDTPIPQQQKTPAQEYNQNFPPLNQVFGFPVNPQQDNFTIPPIVGESPSPEERPAGEFTASSSPEAGGAPEPDWLTPKIYRGGNAG